MRIGYGICNGTFGELVQGVYNKQPFLITMPIPVLTSKAIFIPNETKTIIGHSSYSKAVLACNKLLSLFNKNPLIANLTINFLGQFKSNI